MQVVEHHLRGREFNSLSESNHWSPLALTTLYIHTGYMYSVLRTGY